MKSLLIAALLLVGHAQAHFALIAPPSALRTEDGGKGGPPCGRGAASNFVTTVTGGRALPLRLQEFVFHPGHYRVALAVKSLSELPPDPEVVEVNGSSVSTAIQNPVKAPVLADGLFAHKVSPTADWNGSVVLPNLNCEKCTLQIIEFMAEHSAPYFYHHCADIKIVADPNLPPADASWPRTAVGSGRQTSAMLAHIADGGGWQTGITLVNLDSVPAAFTLNFLGDDGAALAIPFTGLGRLSTVSGTLKVGGSQTIQSDGSPPGVSTGWVQLASPQLIDGSAIFRFRDTGQEASVPLQSSGGKKFALPFDSTAGLALGLAITNTSATDSTTFSFTLIDEQGEVISIPVRTLLSPGQHTSFVLPVSAGKRGVVELESANTDILVLGIRSNNGAITSVQALRK